MCISFENLLEECSKGKIKVCSDSRKVQEGDIFVAINGENEDGTSYICDAIERRAHYIICPDATTLNIPAGYKGQMLFQPDTRKALWELAAARFNTKKHPLTLIGVTGTNGKTTSAFLLEHLFRSNGKKVGVIGTVNYRWGDHIIPAPLTTPDPLTLHELISRMAKDGVEIVIMEVSSHAIAQQRVGGLNFQGALFTNLSQDHLDFHKNMEDYFLTKARLFEELPEKGKKLAINIDDPYGKRLASKNENAISFGFSNKSENHLKGEILEHGLQGMKLEMSFKGKKWLLSTPLVGEFNAMNLLGIQALGLQFGIEDFSSLKNFSGVCGRLERVVNQRNLHIFVDYAHTPDALIKALKALRGAGFKKIITVFGCGGNRDRTKRPLMGRAVAEHSDVAVLTSDNPRFEDPEAIINDVLPGLANVKNSFVEVDRRKATELAIDMMDRETALLVAGKGHEDYQIINGKKYHYSDQETVRQYAI